MERTKQERLARIGEAFGPTTRLLPYWERPASKDTGAPVGPNSNSRALCFRSKEQAPARSTVARELPFASVISTFSSVLQTHFASSTTIMATHFELEILAHSTKEDYPEHDDVIR